MGAAPAASLVRQPSCGTAADEPATKATIGAELERRPGEEVRGAVPVGGRGLSLRRRGRAAR